MEKFPYYLTDALQQKTLSAEAEAEAEAELQ